jgi:hypothetical protein
MRGFVRSAGRLLLFGLLLGACTKKPLVVEPPVVQDELVVAMRARTVPDPLQVRFTVKIKSERMGITAPPLGGGLIVDRPGKAYLAVMSPVGGPVLTLSTNGTAVGLMNARDKQWVQDDHAGSMLGSATGGSVSLDDLVGLLLGLLPLAEDSVRSREEVQGGVRLVVSGPGDTVITAVVDPLTATPREVSVANAAGEVLVTGSYEPFEALEEAWMPTRLQLYVVPIDLSLDLRYKSWKAPEEVADMFTIAAPEGFAVLTFAEYGAAMAETLKEQDSAPQEP